MGKESEVVPQGSTISAFGIFTRTNKSSYVTEQDMTFADAAKSLVRRMNINREYLSLDMDGDTITMLVNGEFAAKVLVVLSTGITRILDDEVKTIGEN